MTPDPPDFLPELAAEVERMVDARMNRLRRHRRMRAAYKLSRRIGVDRRNAASLERIFRERGAAADGDPLCLCNHLAASPMHTRSRHAPLCQGLDSYGLACRCPGYVPMPPPPFDDEGDGR